MRTHLFATVMFGSILDVRIRKTQNILYKENKMPRIWCVRAEYGRFTEQFVKGGYAAIGWIDDNSLAQITSKEELVPLYKAAYPNDKSNIVIGQQVGQISRFLLEMKAGDYIITPAMDSQNLHYGVVEEDPSYYYQSEEDECPFRHRRRVVWNQNTLIRQEFSVPFQNTIKASLTVFEISHQQEFMEAIGASHSEPKPNAAVDADKMILNRIYSVLLPEEFELLVDRLLVTIGFEEIGRTKKSWDGGVDVFGSLNVHDVAEIKLFVQVKCYKPDAKVSAKTVKELRSAIPHGAQGAFFTTAHYDKKAAEIAKDPNFAHIGLIDGKRLVELLTFFWEDMIRDDKDEAMQEIKLKLGFTKGLVLN